MHTSDCDRQEQAEPQTAHAQMLSSAGMAQAVMSGLRFSKYAA